MFLKEDIRGIPDYNRLQTIEHYFEKHDKGGTSHKKEIEKWIVSFERFLSLHKLTSSWHKERIRKGTKIREHFLWQLLIFQ